jgi:hypothetical protein
LPAAAALAAALLLPSLARGQLEGEWAIQVDGRTGFLLPGGGFRVDNVSGVDSFGAGGQNTPPDGQSDRHFRVEGVRLDGARPQYLVSEPFRVRGNSTQILRRIVIRDTPPAAVRSLRLEAEAPSVPVGQSLRLRAFALLSDGGEVDVSRGDDGTTLVTSEPRIASIDAAGVLRGNARGIVFVTAIHFGVTAVKRVEVTVESIAVAIEGFVRLPDGSPAAGVEVDAGFGGAALTDAAGFFSIAITVPEGTRLKVKAELAGEFISFAGESAEIVALSEGVLDAGVIRLAAGLAGPLFDHPALGDGQNNFGLGIGDLDGDQDVDLFTTQTGLTLFRNLGDGDFAPPELRNFTPFNFVRTADLDGNGSVDLVYRQRAGGGNTVTTALNNGDGTFSAILAIPVAGARQSIRDFAVAELDGARGTDLVISLTTGDSVSLAVYLNSGDGAFSRADEVTVVSGRTLFNSFGSIAAGDLDRDGDNDLVLGLDDSIVPLQNDGVGGFTAQQGLPATFITSLGLGDLNGDGRLDVAATEGIDGARSHAHVRIHLAEPSGGFRAPATESVGRGATSLAMGDLDNDGDLDLIANTQPDINAGPGDLTALYNAGDGSFPERKTFTTGPQLEEMALVDVDGDGFVDLAQRQRSGRYLSVLFNRGDGSLRDNVKAATPQIPTSVTAAQLDGEGGVDLAVGFGGGFSGQRVPTGIAVLSGDGAGAFGAAQTLYSHQFSNGTVYLAASDLDRDGAVDLAAAVQPACCGLSNFVAVFLREGDGFRPAAESPLGVELRPTDLKAGDLTGDGFPELIVVIGNAGLAHGFFLLRNRGDGSFEAPVLRETVDSPQTADLGDVDGDGDLDLVVFWRRGGFNFVKVRVFLNDGAGALGEPLDVDAERTPDTVYSGALADFDGANGPDLVLGSETGPAVMVNDGDGGFEARFAAQEVGDLSRLVAADLDGDGDPDVAGLIRGMVFTFLNQGDGTLIEEGRYSAGWGPDWIAAADLDGDGDVDLAAANTGFAHISVLLNRRIER